MMTVWNSHDAGRILALEYTAAYKQASGTPDGRRARAWACVFDRAKAILKENSFIADAHIADKLEE